MSNVLDADVRLYVEHGWLCLRTPTTGWLVWSKKLVADDVNEDNLWPVIREAIAKIAVSERERT